jgi:hypothetical protein
MPTTSATLDDSNRVVLQVCDGDDEVFVTALRPMSAMILAADLLVHAIQAQRRAAHDGRPLDAACSVPLQRVPIARQNNAAAAQ